MTQNLSGIRSEALIGRRSSYIVSGIVYEWQTKDKRLRKPKVNAMNLLQNSQYLWNIFFPRRSIWVLLEVVRRWTQHFTKIDQEKRKIKQICIWNPMTNGFIMLTLIYVISMEFLSLSRKRSSSRNVPSGEERGDTAVFAGHDDENNNVKNNWFYEQNNCSARASGFLVHFDVHYTTTTRNLPMRRFMEDMDILRQIVPSLFDHGWSP